MAKDPQMRAFEASNRESVRETPCPECFAAPGQTCFTGRVFREASHLARVRASFWRQAKRSLQQIEESDNPEEVALSLLTGLSVERIRDLGGI